MRKVLLFLLFCVPSFAQIPLGGITVSYGGTSPAQVRCASSGNFSGTAITVTLPSCKTAGDLTFIFLSTEVYISSGNNEWAPVQGDNLNSGFTNWSGSILDNLLTASDVSAGTVSFTAGASAPGAWVVVEMIGQTGGTTPYDLTEFLSGIGTPTSQAVTSPAYSSGDLVLGIASARNNNAITIAEGTQLATTNITFASMVVNAVSEGSSGAGQTITATYSAGGYNPAGLYQVALIVRSTPASFTPQQIPGLVFAFDANCIGYSSGCTTPTTGTTISTWHNSPSAAGLGTTATGHGTCTYNAAQINGQPAVTFNGSTCYFDNYYGSVNWNSFGYSGVAVAANSSTAAKGTFYGSTNNGGLAYWTCAVNGSARQQGNDAQQTAFLGSGTAACDTNWHQTNFVMTGTAVPTYRIDQITDTTASGGSSSFPTSASNNVGRNGGGSEYFNGKMAVNYLYYRVLSPADITQLETYLYTRYLITPGIPPPPSVVNSANNTPNGTSATSVSTTTPINISSGNLIFVCVGGSQSTGTGTWSVTDTGSTNTFTALTRTNRGDNLASMQCFYAKNAVAKASDTFTFTTTVSTTYASILVLQISGANLTTPIDVEILGTGNSSIPTSGTYTTTNAKDLILAGGPVNGGTGCITGGIPAGYTLEVSDTVESFMLGQAVTSIQTGATTPLSTGSCGTWVVAGAAIRN
jgi:hypothetical protein